MTNWLSLLNVVSTTTILLFAGMLTTLEISAQTTLPEPENINKQISTVRNMTLRLPIETPANGTLIEIKTPEEPLSVITDMGAIPEQNMKAFADHPDLFKNAVLSNFQSMGPDLISLAIAAYNAGIPFAIHITASSYPKGFTILFTIDDLEKGLNQKP